MPSPGEEERKRTDLFDSAGAYVRGCDTRINLQ